MDGDPHPLLAMNPSRARRRCRVPQHASRFAGSMWDTLAPLKPKEPPDAADRAEQVRHFEAYEAARARAIACAQAHEASPTDDARAALDAAQHRRDAVRNALAERYLFLLRRCAERLKARLPGEVDVEDLCSDGFYGLLDAIETFDPSRNTRFETYAPLRIRGAMLDYLRSIDWVPRLTRTRARLLARTADALRVRLGRPATPEEVAQALDVPPDERDRILSDGQVVPGLASLDAPLDSPRHGEPERLLGSVENPQSPRSHDLARRRMLVEFVTARLERPERLIVVLYYFENMSMSEIGATLGISESRVSQLHKQVLGLLKDRLAGREDEFGSPTP